jgi:hypothetical protein
VKNLNAGAQAAVEQTKRQYETMVAGQVKLDSRVSALEKGQSETIRLLNLLLKKQNNPAEAGK